MPLKLSSVPAYSSNVELYGEMDSAGLTPRTPFSRATANAEEGRSRQVGVVPINVSLDEDEDDGNLDEIDLLQTQSHPLLASSTSDSFLDSDSHGTGHRALKKLRWQWLKESFIHQRVPIGLIAGSGLAFMLLFMAVMSIKRPDTLRDYMGVNSTAIEFEALDEESQERFNGSSVINYAQSGFNSFPLSTHQYIQQCWNMTTDPRMKGWVHYWDQHAGGDPDVLHKKPSASSKTCNSSITYILDGSVGLMADLAILAQAAGFARERNRTLFIYDDYWNRGRWEDHFLPISETQPGPDPGCSPPPPEELVACPRTARHWVLSARIAYFHMGNGFEDAFVDPYKVGLERQRPIFERAAESFQGVIFPNAVNENLIKNVRDEIKNLIPPNSNETDGVYIAAHIRRGDRQAMSWRYQSMPNSQIPAVEYADAVLNTYSRLNHNLDSNNSYPLIYLATDSASAASEFTSLVTHNDSYVKTLGNETIRPIVYELRTSPDAELRSLAPTVEYVQKEWSGRAEADRIMETRGVIVDWAVLSGSWGPRKSENTENTLGYTDMVKPTAVICGLPSNICKLAPFGLGWNRSFDLGRWVEIDNRGNIAPHWEPFELFGNT